jgi:cbb3-type cytochrome oxidase maturation protein
MNILYLLIPLGMVLLGIAIWAFMWAVRSGQFDDLEGPAHRILMDDDEKPYGNLASKDTAHDSGKDSSADNSEDHGVSTDDPLQDKDK